MGSLALQMPTSLPGRLEPYAADLHLDVVTSLEYALVLQYLSPLDSSGSSVCSSLAPLDASRAAWLSSAAVTTRRPLCSLLHSMLCIMLHKDQVHTDTASLAVSSSGLAWPVSESVPWAA